MKINRKSFSELFWKPLSKIKNSSLGRIGSVGARQWLRNVEKVRGVKMARMSKKKKIEMLDVARDEERKGIVNLLTDEGKFTPSLEPLIENYLDAFIIYKTMFEEWKVDGFSPTKHIKTRLEQ